MRKSFIAGLLILSSGCAMQPKFDPTKLNYGPEPKNPIAIAERIEKASAADPDAIKIRLDRKVIPYFIYRTITGGDPQAGWMVCYSVNGKNAYGGYVGYQPNFILVNNDYVIHHEVGKKANDLCMLK